MKNVMRSYVRLVDGAAQYVGIVAMYLIFLMVGVLLLDAITRNIIDIPLHWCVEFAQFTLAAYYFMGGAMTIKDGDHVRMDLFYERLSHRGKTLMDLVTISSLDYAIDTNETRFSMWNPSMIPIKSLMVACIVLMILQTISQIFKHINDLRGEAVQ